jgi:cytidylate kinase
MTRKINIAIDGYSSCGKGTLAKALAKELNYLFIDSGSMYRAVTLYFIENKVDFANEVQVDKALSEIQLNFQYVADSDRYEIFLNGVNVESEVRDLRVAQKVSYVAKISAVRRKLVEMQQQIGLEKGVVMDGRDIGTVVFPDAELKIFMIASDEVRAERRYLEMLNAGKDVSYEEVKANLKERDLIDSQREDSPLTMTDDYRILDNTELTPIEQFHLALNWAKFATEN